MTNFHQVMPMPNDISCAPDVLRRKKCVILICGILICFLTSMAKVLVPATIFDDLLKLGIPVDRVSMFGAAFLYAYAASQLLMGCVSDRYGGVRVVLAGGGMFALGTILFPIAGNYYLMLLCRIITGFGSGTIFLGIAKLLGDLFERSFSIMLGAVLFFIYFGPTAGTVPMVKLVECIGWQWAMILPGIAAAGFLLPVLFFMRGTMEPVAAGQTLAPLTAVVKNRKIWYVCSACATVYGVYYAIAGQIGQKILVDIFGFASGRAAFCIMVLTVIVAVNNLVVNLLLKLLGNRRKTVLLLGVIISLAGVGVGQGVLIGRLGAGWFLFSLLLVAFPAGFFSIFSTVAKELNPPEFSVMSIAFINFMAFFFISVYQNIVGVLLKRFVSITETLAFPPEAYISVYWFFIIAGVFSLAGACAVPETRGRAVR